MVHKPLGCRLGTIMFNMAHCKSHDKNLRAYGGTMYFKPNQRVFALFATFSICDRLHRDYQVQVS